MGHSEQQHFDVLEVKQAHAHTAQEKCLKETGKAIRCCETMDDVYISEDDGRGYFLQGCKQNWEVPREGREEF